MTFFDKKAFLDTHYEKYDSHSFYRYIFPVGSFERLGCFDDQKPNGLALVIKMGKNGNNFGRHVVMTDGLEQLDDLLSEDFVITSPISYFGRSRKAEYARWLYALTLDIDYVDLSKLKNLFRLIEVGYVPEPTFVVNSGHGVHLYYCFGDPLPMYKNVQQSLRVLKEGLIEKAWNKETSNRFVAREVLGVVQGFRLVGSKTKSGDGQILEAYKIGEKVTVEYLNSFVDERYRFEDLKPTGRVTKEKARELYPEWYERVVVRGETPGRWYVKRDLYDWFKRKIETGATIGHRYFCCLCLCIYANKCGIAEDELMRDLTYYQKKFDALSLDGSEPFTLDEAYKTLSAYDDSYCRYPRDTMARISGIPMTPNKRNYQKQKDHLEEARAIRDIRQRRQDAKWYDKGGRPSKQQLVEDYVKEHPEANQKQIAETLGITRQTVGKWTRRMKSN